MHRTVSSLNFVLAKDENEDVLKPDRVTVTRGLLPRLSISLDCKTKAVVVYDHTQLRMR